MMIKLAILFVVCLSLVLGLSAARSNLKEENLRRHAAQASFFDIVPILECVDQYNKAYFNYENNEGTSRNVPFSDFNRLSPLNVAPITSFDIGSGPVFPFSATVSLASVASAEFNWDLQEYYLPFTITPSVACPTRFNISLQFVYDYSSLKSFPSSERIIEAFATLAGISASRFVVLSDIYDGPNAKRAILGSELSQRDIELELNDGPVPGKRNVNSTEPTAADVIRDFIENQKQNQLNQIIGDIYTLPSNMTIFEPKSENPQVVLGQIRPPTAPSSVPLTSSTPSTPKSNQVSSATVLFVNNMIAAMAVVVFGITFQG